MSNAGIDASGPWDTPAWREFACAILLCLVGGWADADSYLRFKTFTGAMNGNTILFALSFLKDWPGRPIFFAAILAAFVAGIIGARFARDRGTPRWAMLLLSASLLALSGFVGSHWIACAMAFALGAQNATIRKALGVSINTVFVTGDIAHLAEAAPESAAPFQRRRVGVLAVVWIGYGAGALVGIAISGPLAAFALCVPAGLVLLAAAILPPSRCTPG